ncbi:MAG: hypothetical protein KF703_01325 [Actinobacteria bacterium]|nr:hypothetical protein [Actinomycetota bacterium]
MEKKRKITGPDGTEYDATELNFRTEGEYFNEYLLDDGTVLRFKAVVTKVQRLDGIYDNEGMPVYMVLSNNVVVTSSPDELRKGG